MAEVTQAARPHIIRRTYDWVLHWAETPYGVWALFLLAVAESSFFPIPPDVLLIALALSIPMRAYRYALICTVGSVLGGMIGYGIGLLAWEAVGGFFIQHLFSQAAFDRVTELYKNYDFWIVFTAAFTPIPYKVITIAAGVCKINFVAFLVASIVGRAARFFLVAWLIHHFGRPIRNFIEKYFNLCTIVFTILLIGGIALIKYWDQISGIFR